jgi:hypothetical protein
VTPEDPEPSTGTDFLTLRAWVKDALSKHAEWYKESRECFDFVASRQWDEDDQTALKADGRPAIVFNLVGPTIDAICGMEVNNRQEVKFLPRTQGDAQVNEKLSSLAEWARDECQAEDEESAAFRDDVICGRGVTETRLDFEEEPTGKIIVDRRDPLECFVDPAASKANFADAKYMGDFRDLDTSDAEALFPGVSWSALNATWAKVINVEDGGEGFKTDYPEETRTGLRTDVKPRTVRVVRIQWWERVRSYMVVAPQMQDPMAPPQPSEPQQMSADQWEPMAEEAKAAGYQAQPIWTRAYYQAFLGASTILPTQEQDPNDPEPASPINDIDCFSLTWMTGRWDRNKRFHYGVVRPLMDPQRIVNKSLVQTIQILNTNAKGGLMIEKGAFANAREAEADWSNPSKTVIVADGALSGGRIKERVGPPLPQALASLLEFSMSSIRNVTGVNLEILGAADRDQAASLEYQRRQSAMSILAPLFDALRRYRKTQGYVLIDCLRRLPPGVLVRVVQDEDQQQPGQPPQPGQEPGNAFQPFDPAAFGLDSKTDRFDVIVDEAPASPNQKQETWGALQPFMAGLANNPAAIAVALKYSPLPASAAQELSKAIAGGLPPEVQQQMQQGQQMIADLTKENEALKADKSIEAAKVQQQAQKDGATAQVAQFSAETDRIHKVGQLGAGHGDGGEMEIFKLQMTQQFEALEAARQRDHEAIMQHLKNAGQIAASRVRADATSDPGIETNNEVGA